MGFKSLLHSEKKKIFKYFLLYTHKQNYKIYRILVMQDWTSLTQAQHLGQSFAIKNILLVNRVEIEVSNDTA